MITNILHYRKRSGYGSKTYVDETRMRQIDLVNKAEEPIGNRIIEVPQDKGEIHKRAPYGKFISYVPIGSIKRGEALVKTGNGKPYLVQVAMVLIYQALL